MIDRGPVLRHLLASAFQDGGQIDLVPLQKFAPADVIAVARESRLAAVLGAKVDSRAPSDGNDPGRLLQTFHQAQVSALVTNMLLEARLREVLDVFSRKGVRAIVLKGLVYDRLLYPCPGSRITGDIDLLIQRQDRRTAMQALVELGHEPMASSPGFDLSYYHEVTFRKAGIEVDLHTGFAPPGRAAFDFDAIWTHARAMDFGGASALRLADDHAILYHAFHMILHHFALPAVTLVDLARMLAGKDLNAVVDLARRWRCQQSLAAAVACLEFWAPADRAWPTGGLGWRWRVAGPWREHVQTIDRPSRRQELLVKLAALDSFAQAPMVAVDYAFRLAWERTNAQWRRREVKERLGV